MLQTHLLYGGNYFPIAWKKKEKKNIHIHTQAPWYGHRQRHECNIDALTGMDEDKRNIEDEGSRRTARSLWIDVSPP